MIGLLKNKVQKKRSLRYYHENEMEEGKVKEGGELTLHIGEIALFAEEKYFVDRDVSKSYTMFKCMSYIQRYFPINYE